MLELLHDHLVHFLSNGLTGAGGWSILVYALVVTHVTICSVTIYLHRCQAHRALELHPIASHFFRFWLWMTTGMGTKDFVAVHRKHHAKCETEEDPHSPQTRGIAALLLTGVELYRAEARNPLTLAKYGSGTPEDWIERRLYTPHSVMGIALMLIIDVSLFGAIGLAVWAMQMAWIPVMATGIINGVGHWWGYRNFESNDASRNVSLWGVLIGGEELHNNHHTYPTAARFSIKPWEFDIGWFYIRALERFGLAHVKKLPPKLAMGTAPRALADGETLHAIITHRYEVMASFARAMRQAIRTEMKTLHAQGGANSKRWQALAHARRWIHCDREKIPDGVRPHIDEALRSSPRLNQFVSMREELRMLWTRTGVSAEHLVSDLQDWCARAERSGITALEEFSMKLRSVTA